MHHIQIHKRNKSNTAEKRKNKLKRWTGNSSLESSKQPYHFLCFNAIELMSTITTSVHIAKCSCVTDITCNEWYSLNNVPVNHLLYMQTHTHTHILTFNKYHNHSVALSRRLVVSRDTTTELQLVTNKCNITQNARMVWDEADWDKKKEDRVKKSRALNGTPSELWGDTCHMGSQHYLPPITSEHTPP